MPQLVDLSHAVANGTVTYPGLPAAKISDYMSRDASRSNYAAGTTFHIARIEIVANTGTYVDAPSHRWENAADIAAIPLAHVADLEGVLIEGTTLSGQDVRDRAVLFRTGWSRHFGTPQYGSGHPFLTVDTVDELIGGRAALVGIDSLNVDDTRDLTRPAHSRLLAAGIPIVEHLTNLDQLLHCRFRFFAAPAKFIGMDSFPVRAFAIVQ